MYEVSHRIVPAKLIGAHPALVAVPVSRGTLFALIAILLIAAYFRLVGLNWDSFTHIHPDERFITMVEGSLSLPNSLGSYFDTARSPLNPYNQGYNSFVYGTLPLFLGKVAGNAFGMSGYDEIHLVGRALSALFDLGSVVLIFLIGRRVYGSRAGLLAALLTAGTVTHIQQSHFFTFDTFVVFFSLAAFFFSVRLWQDPHRYDYLLLGGSLGLAMACKINSAVFAVVVALVAIKQMREVTLREDAKDWIAGWIGLAAWFVLSALTALVFFRVAEPYAFAGPGSSTSACPRSSWTIWGTSRSWLVERSTNHRAFNGRGPPPTFSPFETLCSTEPEFR